MAGAVRFGDSDTGHDDFPARSNTGGSDDVVINGKGAHRVGDSWPEHAKDVTTYNSQTTENDDGTTTTILVPVVTHYHHAGTASTGSGSVYVNGKALCRIGDNVSCGSTIATGSANVVVNEL